MEIGNATAAVRSYAKVNLTLDVLGARPDGYHAIESVMQSIGLHDIITLTVGGEPGIRIECDMPGIPTNKRNLAHEAARFLFGNTGINVGLEIRIEKRIPVEAGLGGGSSNAAAVLTGVTRLLALNPRPESLNSIAAAVGSDVPFFIVGGTALIRGRGEEVEPLPDIPAQWLVILKPPFGVSTPWAYRRLDEMRGSGGRGSCRADISELDTASARMTKCIRSGAWAELPNPLSNDLEPAAIEQHPEIGRLKEVLLRAGAQGALMCGSGSAVFGIFPSEDAARRAEQSLAGADLQVFVCRTITRQEASGIG